MESNGNTMYTMPVMPMNYGGGGNGFGNGFGGDGWWILLLILFAGGGLWGNNGNGFGGGGGGNMLYPWTNQADITTSGFRDQMLNDNITSIRDGVYGINNQLCSGFAGVNASINGAQNALAQQLYVNQISDLERSFAAQTANTAGLTNLQSQLANCCCENRMATADLKYTVATENCADRTAAMQNTRDIIDSQTRGTQAILDKLCALELDGIKGQLAQAQRENAGLQNQLNMANLAASQVAQTAQIVDQTYSRLSTCPVGTVPVYGEQPIFRCNNNNGCGCGCNGGFAA